MSGINFNDTDNKAGATGGSTGDFEVGTYSPSASVSGGTNPQYSSVSGRYIRIGKMVYVDIFLSGDGGAEGSGANSVEVTLPFQAGSSILSHSVGDMPVGIGTNGTTHYMLVGVIAPSSNNILLRYWGVLTDTNPFAGNLQNNTSRTIRLHFFYEKA